MARLMIAGQLNLNTVLRTEFRSNSIAFAQHLIADGVSIKNELTSTTALKYSTNCSSSRATPAPTLENKICRHFAQLHCYIQHYRYSRVFIFAHVAPNAKFAKISTQRNIPLLQYFTSC